MGQNYITKYKCWDYMCDAVLDTYDEAATHCIQEYPEEVYFCELCGYETTDNTDAESDCKYHRWKLLYTLPQAS